MRPIAIAVLLAVSPISAIASDLFYSGNAIAVADGDTFTMVSEGNEVRVRICGIDSPERGKPGYGRGAGRLSELVEGKEVRCIQVGGGTPCDGRSPPKSRDRIVAQCFVGDRDIAMEMVCSSAASDWRKFSGGHYAKCAR